MPEETYRFTVSVPTDKGFMGRECNNPECRRYFKVHSDFLKSSMFCPYCGMEFPNDSLWTTEQKKYVEQVANEKGKEIFHNKVDAMMSDFARTMANNPLMKVKFKPTNYKAKEIIPQYKEKEVDSELTCPQCNFIFQVYGLFGYCPGCRSENLLVYDANLAIIRLEFEKSKEPRRDLRHSYNDLVATFESFCRKSAAKVTTESTRFQSLFDTRKFFKDLLGVDIFHHLSTDELLTLRRIFQKRHINEHEGGIVNEKYVQMIPEDAELLKQPVPLSIEEFISGAAALRKVLDKLSRSIEKE